MTAVIGYESAIPAASNITASAETAGFEKENAYDWIEATQWKPGNTGSQWLEFDFAVAGYVNYFGVAAHNLGSEGCTVSFQYEQAGWQTIWTYTPYDNSPILRYTNMLFNRTKYRLLIENCTVNTVIGVHSFGIALLLPQAVMPGDWAPAPFARKNESEINESENGIFLSRSTTRRGIRGLIRQTFVDPQWIRVNWEHFADHMEAKPFFYAPDYDNYPDEAGLYWVPGMVPQPTYMDGNPFFMQFELELNGRYQ